MAALSRLRRPALRPGLPAAALAHAALLAWLASAAIRQFDPAPVVEQSIEVELRTPEEFEALTRPEPPVPLPSPAAPLTPPDSAAQPDMPAAPPPENPAPLQPGGMVRPRRMLSQRALADPRSREALALLPQLVPEDRVEQLCGVEAMGQIHDWRKELEPDRVTAYAMAETRLEGGVLKAEGAAFRSRRHWYALRFECTVSADLTRVTAFAFHVGEPIPAARWRALGLPAIH